MGVRQLRHAVQGVRAGRRPPRPVREGRGRRAGAPLHRRRADGRAAHPVGRGRRLRRARRARRGPRRRARHDQRERVPGQRLHARQRHATRTRACAARRSTTCSSASTSWTPPGRATSSCGSPTAPTTPARTTSAPARTASPRRCARSTTGSPATSGWCSSTSCSSRPSTRWTCPTGAPRTRTASRSASGAVVCVDTGHHAPGTNIEFIVAVLLRAGKLGAFDFNSRFYADDDLMVGAADPFQLFRIMHEVVRRRRPAARPTAASRSCSTSATTSSRRSPARSARCMNVQEATAKALLVDRDALGRRPGGRRRARRERRPDGRLQHRRAAAARRAARGAGPRPGPDGAPTRAPATPSRSRPSGSAGSRPAGALSMTRETVTRR